MELFLRGLKKHDFNNNINLRIENFVNENDLGDTEILEIDKNFKIFKKYEIYKNVYIGSDFNLKKIFIFKIMERNKNEHNFMKKLKNYTINYEKEFKIQE